MNLLEDLKMSILNFNFVMIYIVHKMLVLIKNNFNYLKDSISECFFNDCNRLLIFYNFFPQHIIVKKLSLEEENLIKDIGNLFILKKELNYTAIKDIRNFFGLEKQAIKDGILRDIKNLFEHEEKENCYKYHI